ncbi:MAG: type I 3-dehydroquinate dehydratase [Phycisphaerales bacterium]|nr:type I 3-dehydroquinate dehydratase [Phycisphaerales bacterium]
MTRLVASIPVDSPEQAAALVERACADGAPAIELRIDGYDGPAEPLRALVAAHPRMIWIVTCRSGAEGGAFTGGTMQRVARLIEAARGTGAWVDFELADWRRSDNIRQKVLLAATDPANGRVRLILSHHRFDAPIADPPTVLQEICAARADVVAKLAWKPQDIGDNFTALELVRSRRGQTPKGDDGGEFTGEEDQADAPRQPATAICMGEEGLLSRVLAKKFGAGGSYAAVQPESSTAPGQVTVEQLKTLYRWDVIDANTRWFGVLGDPVVHSLSPRIFNRLFAEHALNAVYLPLLVRGEDALKRFVEGVRRRPWLDVGGFSVTMPHKERALRCADDVPDVLTRRIAAANTLVLRDGRLHAHNTDAPAVADALTAALESLGLEPAGMAVDVLGTGGAARAVLGALILLGCRACVMGKRDDAARRLADEFGCECADWSRRNDARDGVLINATCVGMSPRTAESPVTDEGVARRTLVFDLVYNPQRTALLADAGRLGVPTLDGVEMFVRQAAAQFLLWTGLRAVTSRLRAWVEAELHRRGSVVAPAPMPENRASLKRSIALIGYRGSGKTTVARHLARLLGVAHVDTDEMIVARAGRTIREIFEQEGEPSFRRIEREVIAALPGRPPCVISVGGGAIEDPENGACLKRLAEIIWLTASPETLHRRLEEDASSRAGRPALTSRGGLDEVRAVLDRRAPLYQGAADRTIDTTHRTPWEIASEIGQIVSTICRREAR